MEESPRRWVVALIAVAAVIALLLLARGEPDGGRAAVGPSPVEVTA